MRYLFIGWILLGFVACDNDPGVAQQYHKLQGKTMGTTYNITYKDSLHREFQPAIDSLLVAINQAVSTYIPSAEISVFNRGKADALYTISPHFQRILEASFQIYQQTNGNFDPTVMPLVNYWGFGYTDKNPVTQLDSAKVDSLRQLVGLEKVRWQPGTGAISKTVAEVQLDFSAIAKGYAVDQVGALLAAQGIHHYLVEIGGEMLARGTNPRGVPWTTAINTPKMDARLTDYEAIIALKNKAIATSGNYRNFHQVNGEWYGHEINPKTGYPEKSHLLSVSILAKDCMTADAWATALMVMGLESSKKLVEQTPGLEGFFIFSNAEGELEQTYTPGFESLFIQQSQ